MKKTIAIASDHAGFLLKNFVKDALISMGYEVLDLGTNSTESVDYPDYAHAVAKVLKDEKIKYGVLICGSGIGISIAANRHSHIRAALCHNVESARLSRQHNNANILVLGQKFVNESLAKEMLETFFVTKFEGGRHEKRLAKL